MFPFFTSVYQCSVVTTFSSSVSKAYSRQLKFFHIGKGTVLAYTEVISDSFMTHLSYSFIHFSIYKMHTRLHINAKEAEVQHSNHS